MKEQDLKKAIKRYNSIMFDFCWEHCTIGTRFSEDTEGWNLRDMVSECQYHLDTCYEEGNLQSEGSDVQELYDCNYSYNEVQSIRKEWLSKTRRLRNFIEAYKPYIGDLKCVVGHCSDFD